MTPGEIVPDCHIKCGLLRCGAISEATAYKLREELKIPLSILVHLATALAAGQYILKAVELGHSVASGDADL